MSAVRAATARPAAARARPRFLLVLLQFGRFLHECFALGAQALDCPPVLGDPLLVDPHQSRHRPHRPAQVADSLSFEQQPGVSAPPSLVEVDELRLQVRQLRRTLLLELRESGRRVLQRRL